MNQSNLTFRQANPDYPILLLVIPVVRRVVDWLTSDA